MSLSDCPVCMSPLDDGEEDLCPNCGSDLSAFGGATAPQDATEERREEPIQASETLQPQPVADAPPQCLPQEPQPTADAPPQGLPREPEPVADAPPPAPSLPAAAPVDPVEESPADGTDGDCQDDEEGTDKDSADDSCQDGQAGMEPHLAPPIEVFREDLRYQKGDAGCITISIHNRSGERLDLVDCELDSHQVPLLDKRRSIHFLFPDDEREEHFDFRDDAPGGQHSVTARFKCVNFGNTTRFYKARFRIKIMSPDIPQHVHYHEETNITGKYVIARDTGGQSFPGIQGAAPGSSTQSGDPEWVPLKLVPDDEAAREAAEDAAARNRVRVVEVVPGREEPAAKGPHDLATLSHQLPNCREEVTICSRPRFVFGADRLGRTDDVVIWPPPIIPITDRNWQLYRAVSRRHGELHVGHAGVALAPMRGCPNGLMISGQVAQPSGAQPILVKDKSVIEFPHTGISYQARIFYPRAGARRDRLASLVTLNGHGMQAGHPEAAGPAGLMGMEGYSDIDAVRFTRQRNASQEGSADLIHSLVILIREARIGSGSDNTIVVSGAGVERVHATIMLKGGSYWLQDLSMGGVTRVGRTADQPWCDRRLEIGDSVRLFDGARITLGENVLEFRYGQDSLV